MFLLSSVASHINAISFQSRQQIGGKLTFEKFQRKMRIQADIEILNRDFNSKTKPVRSSLAIGLKPQDSSSKAAGMREVFIMISTAQNKSGNKFVLRNDELQRNVEHIFDKFVNEGKATIRLKVPARDFCLRKADPLLLKSFLNMVKASLNAKTPEEIDKLSLTSASYATPGIFILYCLIIFRFCCLSL